MKKYLVFAGIAMALVGFSAVWHIATMFPATDPPTMRPIEGVDRLLLHNEFAFMLMGITGIAISVIGTVLWRKR